MLIAIFSDLHDNLNNLKIFLNYLQQKNIKTILFCGDATRAETLVFFSLHFPGQIKLIKGNAEVYEDKDLKKCHNLKNYGYDAYIELAKIKILMTHKKKDVASLNKKYSQSPDFIFYGHSHKPWIEENKQTIIANPGNLADIRYPATFAILDTDSKILELKILSHYK